nr:hypothetical protein [Tanacetum cinerariifolium]
MGDDVAQTRSERVYKISNDPMLTGVKTPRSRKDILKLNELMDLCINLQNRVLVLVGLSARVESSNDEILGEEDASKHERIIDDLDTDEDIMLVNDQEMFDADKDLQGEEVAVEQEVVVDKEPIVNDAQVSVAATTVTIDDITLAKALEALKTLKPKIRGIVIKDHEEPKKINDEERPVRERARQEKKANIALIETWEDIQAKQKIVDDKETANLKQLVKIIPKEDIAIDDIPLAIKTLIVDWKIYKEGKKNYYQIIRVGGKLKNYLVFSYMFKDFDREDVETLWKLVKAKYGSARPEEDYDRVLWGDLKVMFEPHIEDEVWKM